MALSETLRETLQELTDQRTRELAFVENCIERKELHRQTVAAAEQREREAKHEDDEIVRKKSEVTALYNSMADKPQVLLDKINSLGLQQSVTYRSHQQAVEATRNAQGALQRALTQLALAEKNVKETQKRIDECTELIRQQEQIS